MGAKTDEIQKEAKQACKRAVRALSTTKMKFIEQRNVLKSFVKKLREVEEQLKPCQTLVDKGYKLCFPGTDQGDFIFFATQVDKTKVRISEVYKEALYPFLLVLQCAKDGSDPSSILNQAYISWNQYWTTDPKDEIERELFPTPLKIAQEQKEPPRDAPG